MVVWYVFMLNLKKNKTNTLIELYIELTKDEKNLKLEAFIYMYLNNKQNLYIYIT